MLGFGAYPTYLLADAGYGRSMFYLAGGAFVEAGARLGEQKAPVVGLRANADLVLLNVGVRLLGSLERRPEVGLWLIAGLGRY